LGSAIASKDATPGLKAWDKSSNMPAILSIGVSESSLQLRFLDERNIENVEN